jgi:serine protease Do
MRHTFLRCIAALIAVCLTVSAGAGTENSPSGAHSQPYPRRNPVVEAVRKTRQSIVTVKVPRAGSKDMTGTGVIIDERGYVVTNRHVVGSRQAVRVRLHDGTELAAQVLVAEAACDLAVLKISHDQKLPALPLAPTTDLMVGETVIAVGHPYGYTNTVSTGIISALDREITMPTGEVIGGLIQTDASINPGNSGGPLLNINGELIGINVALREGAQGIAFALNASMVENMLRRNFSAFKVAGVRHGLALNEKVTSEVGERQKVVVASYATEAATGLQEGDEIVAVGGRRVANRFDVERALWDRKPGEKVSVRILRGSQEVTVDLTLRGQSEDRYADARSDGHQLPD